MEAEVKDSSETDDLSDESSPIESRYEVPDSDSEEDEAYDVIFGEVLRDILETLQSHPEFLKGLTNSKSSPHTPARACTGALSLVEKKIGFSKNFLPFLFLIVVFETEADRSNSV